MYYLRNQTNFMSTHNNALIVGGNSGIGQSIAIQLMEDGYNVHCLCRKAEGIPQGATHVAGDVLSEDWTSQSFPDSLDALVYCPGSINLKPFRSLKPADFQNDFDINVMGAVKVLHHFQKALKKGTHPSVLLFSTVAVQQGMPFHASISSAKGAVEGLVRTLAAEWSPKIRVNAIAPSLVDTPLAGQLLSNDSKRENADQRHPLKRVGQPDDIAAAARFLLSENASWVSGQIIGVDGGLSSLRV